MKNQLKFLALQLLFVTIMFSSCSLIEGEKEDELSLNDRNCFSIAEEYSILLADHDESVAELSVRLGLHALVGRQAVPNPLDLLSWEKDETGNISYIATAEKWRKDDPLQRENKFREFVNKNKGFCSYIDDRNKMINYTK